MQQEALTTLFISCKESRDVALASWEICLTRTSLHEFCLSLSPSTLFIANFLHSTFSWILDCHLKVVQNLGWFSIAFKKQNLIVGLAFDTLCFLKSNCWCSVLFIFSVCRTYFEQLSSQEQFKDWFQVEPRRGDTMSTLRSMIGSDAKPPSVQWSAASVVSGDVMERAKLMVLLIMLTLTACGLYRNRCRPRAVQSQASSPSTSTPPPTEAMG
jgi:hypothetical protein